MLSLLFLTNLFIYFMMVISYVHPLHLDVQTNIDLSLSCRLQINI